MAQRSVHVSHQPLSNCEMGGGLAPLPEMLAASISVALGTLAPGNQAHLLLIGADLPTPLAAHNTADQLLL